MKTKTIAWILLVSLIPLAMVPFVLAAANVEPFSGRNGLLKICKFDEQSGEYDKCFWKWDKRLDSPSVYY